MGNPSGPRSLAVHDPPRFPTPDETIRTWNSRHHRKSLRLAVLQRLRPIRQELVEVPEEFLKHPQQVCGKQPLLGRCPVVEGGRGGA
jgi:hypothetical protein